MRRAFLFGLACLSSAAGCALVGFDLGGYGPADASSGNGGAGSSSAGSHVGGHSAHTSSHASTSSTGLCPTCCGNGVDDLGEVCFGTPTDLDLGSSVGALAIGDIDGDGNLDVVAALPASNEVLVLRNAGDGSLSPAAAVLMSGPPSALAILDVVSAGSRDIAVGTAGGVTVLLNASSSGFVNLAVLPNNAAGAGPQFPAGVVDMATGLVDLVAADQLLGGVTVFSNKGGGVFAAPVSYVASSAGNALLTGIAVGDLDGDGVQDFAVLNQTADQVWLYSQRSAAFSGTPVALVAPIVPAAIAVADVDGDGNRDIVVLDANGSVRVLFGDDKGSFEEKSFPVKDPSSMALADFDGDGHPDLAIASASDGTVTVFLTRARGPLVAGPVLTGFLSPGAIAVGDLDGDDKPDIVVAEPSGIRIARSTN